ncbi:MAG TPA: hypothetical protein VED19_01020 [Candidatus Nitrosopolaris sp.]|nr:hypothetical protein [Candidatus Nitrosopolaris sp.]
MKTLSGLARGAGCQSTEVGAIYLALVLGTALFATGCGKAKAPAPSAPSAPAPSAQQADTNQAETGQVSADAPAAPPEMPAPPNVTTNAAPNAAPDMGQLQRALARWLVRNRRVPANFEEFAATAGVTIPPPPPGKKYFIVRKTMQIMLVDQ